jgi:hypothetical protein
VRGQGNDGITPLRQHVEALRFYLDPLNAAAGSRGQLSQMIEQKQPDLLLVGRHRVDIYESARELKQVHNKSLGAFQETRCLVKDSQEGLNHFPIALHPARKNQVE